VAEDEVRRAMRILITVPWSHRLGGAEEMLEMVLGGASAAGHELEFVFFDSGPWPEELIKAGFRVEVIPAGRLREMHRFLGVVARLTKLLRRRRPDLIVNWTTKTQLYGAPAAILAGMTSRVVWWQHAIPEPDWTDRLANALPARAIGCYTDEAARAQRRLFPRRRTLVVAAGARTPRAAAPPAPLELPGDVPIIGIVGRLQPWKGQDRLLRAQAILRDRGHEIHLLIVGGDAHGLSAEYAASLPLLVEELGLGGAVTMTGQVADAGPYIERMTILVNASDPEPFGIVLMEAMARGVAVVAVDSGGPGEFIEHERTGVLAISGEPAALADALIPLLGSAQRREAVGRAGREQFMREFTEAAVCERFYRQLEMLIEDVGKA
jgi:glycosyltransferase involved in cell wall biosynthesis